MPIKLANNASGTLATAISASDTGIALTTGNGALFPTLAAGEYFYATLTSTAGTQEIVKATARSGDSLTVVRAQEGTVAQSFAAGARFELRVTAASVGDAVDEAEAYALGLDTALRANLAAATGSSLVGFQQAGAGAVVRTVETKLRETVSVKDFGAVGDGVTDDSAAFIACLNSNPTSAGFDVQLEAKTYKINAAALYFTRRIRFFGVSRNVTVLDFSSCTTVVNAPYNAHIIFVHLNNITGSSSSANPITLPAGWVGTYGEMGGLFDLTVKCNPSVSDGNGVFYNVAANSSNILVRNANLHNIVIAGSATNLLTRGGTAGPSGLDIGGNSNNGVYINLKAQVAVNGDGIHVTGSDGNANLFLHPDASSNKGWGVNDASSLGNTYSQAHTAANLYGAYRSRPASANRSTFLSPYTEGGQGTDNSNTFFEMSARAIILGALGVTPDGVFPAINSENDGLVAHQTLSVMDAANTEDTGGTFGRVGRGLLSMRTTDGLLLEVKRSGSAYTTLFYGGASAIEFHNSSNGAINSTRPNFPNGFSAGTAHAQTVGTAAPTTGTWQRGNIVWNTTPSAGGYAGWICTASGTPGTWKEFGAIVV